jgi:hypothetical protein
MNMRPWVKWMIAHKLGYVIFAILIIAIPFVALFVIVQGVPKFLIEAKDWLVDDWMELWREVKRASGKQ